MKKFLSLIFLIGLTLSICAQTQIATLSHEGKISTFYGVNSLKDAHNQAENGDVITLSAGSFKAVDFTKLITVRGAGMGIKVDASSIYMEPTVIVGNFNVTADANSAHHFTLEGISSENTMTLRGTNGTQFIKCKFYDVNFVANYGSLENCTFVHCYVSNSFGALYNTSFTAISTYFKKKANFYGSSCMFNLNNCIIEVSDSYYLSSTSLKNCIIIYTGSEKNPKYPTFNNNTSAYNTLWYGEVTENPFGTTASEHFNSVMSSSEKLFEDDTFGKLTTAAKKYLGADGTEVGIYGGNLPFDATPTNPQITKFNVASKTTADGKLSVDIEVKQP